MKTHCFSLFGLPVLLLLGGCLSSGDGSKSLDIEQQVQQHDRQLKQIQPSQADVYNQLQAMRQELDAIKGQMDDFQQAGGARAITERINRQDAALRQVETDMSINLNLGDPTSIPAGQPFQPTGDALPLAQSDQPLTIPQPAPGATPQPVAPQGVPMTGDSASTPTYGQPEAYLAGSPGYTAAVPEGTQAYPTAQGYGQPQTAQVPSGETWGQPSPRPAAPEPAAPKNIALALFDAGVNSFNARNYTEAQRSFSDFLKNYATHAQASKAQYYLAECYFQRNQFPDATLAYDTVIKKYPKSASAPGAYLKQGICFSKLNQSAAAKARMQELIKKFPNSPEAARAKTFLKTNK
ncbi:MAG: tol-pal system protein YbgF [Desulfovibrio sp.]|jgi:tol-pal system protein YbgF|nr:tol-pal system protein YbgF [Desulfovibrio sp.]